ncbi:MAG: hypothetical protein JXA20_16380 [Spirochaetes bacterium]|nr:hypothetical protein [Spirochaetota bacterium]
MKRSVALIFAASAMLAAVSCASDSEIGTIDPSRPRLEVLFSFNTSSYKKFVKTFYPQIAVWVTEEGRNFTKTIYATESGAREDWWGADTRPSALPVWGGVRSRESALNIDSVSGATPSGETFKISWPVPDNLRGKRISVYVEANISFDYNAHYPEEAKRGERGFSDVNGQPSIVWKGTLQLSGQEAQAIPVMIGHGHVLGENGSIDGDLSSITTAKGLFNYLKVVYRAGSTQ